MADGTFYEMMHKNLGIRVISLSFAPAGTGAPTDVKGRGVTSVVRDSAGKFTITLKDKFLELMGLNVVIAMTAVADLKPQLGAVDVVTAKTVVLNILAVATATDIAANAANRVYVTLFLRNSSVT